MKNYIQELYKNQKNRLALLEEMHINRKDDVREFFTYFIDNKIFVDHGKNKNNETIKSIYSDFSVEKLYNSEPSLYDQTRFQNFMIEIFGKEYLKDLKEYYAKQNQEKDIQD